MQSFHSTTSWSLSQSREEHAPLSTKDPTHPNVFELVEIFKQEQSDTELSIAQLDTGSQPPKRAKKSVDKDKKIGELKNRFSQNEITLEEYVRGISAHTVI